MGNSPGREEEPERDRRLNDACRGCDFDEVKRLVEVEGVDPTESEPKFLWFDCQCAGPPARDIARYLHAKGVANYDAATAVEVDDLERVKEVIAESNLQHREKLLRKARSAAMARYLFDILGRREGSYGDGIYDLHSACALGDVDRIREIAHAAGTRFDVNEGQLFGRMMSEFWVCAYTTPEAREAAAAEQREKHHMTVEWTLALSYPIERAAFYAPSLDALRCLVEEFGANVETLLEVPGRNSGERVTLRERAISLGRLDVARYLSEHGARAPWHGDAAAAARVLNAAAELESPGVLASLLDPSNGETFDINSVDERSHSPLWCAINYRRVENVKLLLAHNANIEPDNVRQVVRSCDVELASLLLERPGVSVLPKHVCQIDFERESDEDCRTFLEFLHTRGVDLSTAWDTHLVKINEHSWRNDDAGDGPVRTHRCLHEATAAAAVRCIEFLLSVGCDPDALAHPPMSSSDTEVLADDISAFRWSRTYGTEYSNEEDEPRVVAVRRLFEDARRARQGQKEDGTKRNKRPKRGRECDA